MVPLGYHGPVFQFLRVTPQGFFSLWGSTAFKKSELFRWQNERKPRDPILVSNFGVLVELSNLTDTRTGWLTEIFLLSMCFIPNGPTSFAGP